MTLMMVIIKNTMIIMMTMITIAMVLSSGVVVHNVHKFR